MMRRDYQMCKRCVMDTTDPNIVFDENGICNHCSGYFEKRKKIESEVSKKSLQQVIAEIKENRKHIHDLGDAVRTYDCVLGVSGGTDSSYLVYLAKKFGLDVLLMHLDNEWDTEIATKNIENIVEKTGFPIFNYKVDSEEFRDLQLAYLKASVVDIEVVTDHAINAIMFTIANQRGIKYILSGNNIVTEGIMPTAWLYRKNDLTNLKSIHKTYGKLKLRTYPTLGILKLAYYTFIKGIQFVSLLNYVDYNKKEAKKVLHNEFGWEDYGGKHCESIFTKFYQNYILPTKFGIDKRKAHLSTLICSGQITRKEALKELEKPLYKKDELERDKKYVLEKLCLSEKEFEDLMKLPIKKHQEYGTDKWIRRLLLRKS